MHRSRLIRFVSRQRPSVCGRACRDVTVRAVVARVERAARRVRVEHPPLLPTRPPPPQLHRPRPQGRWCTHRPAAGGPRPRGAAHCRARRAQLACAPVVRPAVFLPQRHPPTNTGAPSAAARLALSPPCRGGNAAGRARRRLHALEAAAARRARVVACAAMRLAAQLVACAPAGHARARLRRPLGKSGARPAKEVGRQVARSAHRAPGRAAPHGGSTVLRLATKSRPRTPWRARGRGMLDDGAHRFMFRSERSLAAPPRGTRAADFSDASGLDTGLDFTSQQCPACLPRQGHADATVGCLPRPKHASHLDLPRWTLAAAGHTAAQRAFSWNFRKMTWKWENASENHWKSTETEWRGFPLKQMGKRNLPGGNLWIDRMPECHQGDFFYLLFF